VAEHDDETGSTARRPRPRTTERSPAAGGAHAAEPGEPVDVRVDLPPAPTPQMPDDEVAVAIDDVAVDPGGLGAAGTSTTSVEVHAPALSSGSRLTPARTSRSSRTPAPTSCPPSCPRPPSPSPRIGSST
jgi:hypothetical protein